ncbi:MAG: DUF4982 domain-containing protein [Cyclobacteriaceae bacterium]
MRLISILFVLLLFISQKTFAQLPFGFPKTDRTKTNLNQGWKFHLGDPDEAFYENGFDDSNWETVTVPHTLALTSLTLDGLKDDKTQLIFHRLVGWYRRAIEVTDVSKKIYLEFEGVHQVTDVWVNGVHVGQHAVGGYTPFHFDISDYVQTGNNQVTVLADNRRNEVIPPDPGPFDYVKFSGLYRDVYLVETNPIHVTFNWESINSGVYITTPTIDPVNKNATINIKTSVRNDGKSEAEVTLYTCVIDSAGMVVARMENGMTIGSGMEFQFNQITSLEDDVQFWDTSNPYLYRVNSVVKVDGKEVDFVENRIGLREFGLDPEKGFMLNGQPIELIGMNRHQQYPYVGDAVPNGLHKKDISQLKEFGFNIVRTAHYPQDDALMDACDELGILAYEEAPTWISISQQDEWWENLEQAARVMIRNHRNHPSLVMWGAGVNHRGYVPQIHNVVKQEDPIRLTASQGSRWTGWQASGLTDINANMLYGPFIWDRSEPMFAMEGRVGAAAVAPFKNDPMMTGLISWTAHAYYTFHPSHAKSNNPIDRTRSGMMTIFRYPRPEHQWYKSELVDEPFLFIHSDWVAGTDSVRLFSNAPEVELWVNGQSMGRQKPIIDSIYLGLEHPPFQFNVQYEEGEILAKAYFTDGTVSEESKRTPGKPYRIQLWADIEGRDFIADGNDLVMLYAKVVDKNGTTIPDASHLIQFETSSGTIVGTNKGINSNPMFTEYGVAPALLRASKTAGEVVITASSEGLKKQTIKVNSKVALADEIAKTAKPIYDFRSERVDMGAPDQLTQFGWNYWNGTDEEPTAYSFKKFEGARLSIEAGSEKGIVRWLGEMNVIGKYGFAFGDGVVAVDKQGVNLVFDNLPQGNYRLKTWHHAPRSNSDEMDPNQEKLKALTLHKMPYETTLSIQSENFTVIEGYEASVTAGKEMQWALPGLSEVVFNSDGINRIKINFSGTENKGIWINAIELSEWK